MKFKNLLLYIALVMSLLMVACDDKTGGDNTGTEPTPDEQVGDVVDQVSQYTARKFDGQKRADLFYEIFVRSFADSDGDGKGDLNGVTAKLDYLDDMGIAGIWLLPVFECNSYHGYDVIDYEVINPDYGTMADMEKLIAEAHKRKIRVILDFVPNHTSNLNPWFTTACSSEDNDYRSFYHFSTTADNGCWKPVPTGTTNYYSLSNFDPYNGSMPDLNYGPSSSCASSGAFKAMTDAAKFWVDKGVDGFRLDAVKHIYDNESATENSAFLSAFYNELNDYFRGKSKLGFNDIYMVGECWLYYTEMAKFYKGLPALFDFTGWEARMSYAIQNSHAKWFPKDMIEQEKEYAKYRSDFIHATKLSNHDENRARTTLGGSIERAKMAAAILLTSVGSPYIYYGEEIGMLGDKSKDDIYVREPMMWAPKESDKMRPTWHKSQYNFELNVGNVETQAKDPKSIYNVYRKFARLRNTYPALAYGTMELPSDFNDADNNNKQVMVFYREAGSERLLVVHNVSDKASTHVVKHTIKAPIADMNGVTVKTIGTNEHQLTMPPYSSIIIEI